MVMETPEGEWSIEELHPGCVLYVPPHWAHRSVNTGQLVNLVTFFILNDDPQRNDAIMEQMPPASIIINATGMGKDLPGSPITNQGIFPENAIAWELNYRGKLGFMHQARAQSEARQVRVEDGWLYFLRGWTQVIAQVYQLEIVGDLFDRLAAIAGGIAR